MKKGSLIIFSAPSGAGKTSIVQYLIDNIDNLNFSVSATNRPKREGEKNGIDYYFLSTKEFKQKINNNEFIEWEEVYKNRFYGTLKAEIETKINDGQSVIFDVDVVGGLNIKKQYPKNSLAVFIKPPSIDELKKRLKNRKTDNSADISMRTDKAAWEMRFANEFDHIIINNNLIDARKESIKLIKQFLDE